MKCSPIIFIHILIIFLATFNTAIGCTSGSIASVASADKRPILWKNRDYLVQEQRIMFVSGTRYNYLAMGDNVNYIYMGLNETGLAMGNTLMTDLKGGNGNASTIDWLLQNMSRVDDCRNAVKLDHYPGEKPSFSLSLVDATGKVFLIEKGSEYYEYDPLNFGGGNVRSCAVIVRTNSAHANPDGSDDSLTGGSRYIYGRTHLENAVSRDGISENDPIDHSGVSVGEVFKASRWGSPGFDSEEKTTRLSTLCAMVVHGVNSNEDPAITVMWSALHKPDYIPFIPLWYQIGSNGEIPFRLTIQNNSQSLMSQAESIFNRRDSMDFDLFINKRIEPMEKNFIDAAASAREKWFNSGFVYSEAKNICHNATETGFLTLKAIADQMQYNTRSVSKTPEFDSIHVEIENSSVTFTPTVHDSDGFISTYFWDFGDGNFGSGSAPVNNYRSNGNYLIMCRVQDNSGMCNSLWKYITINKYQEPFFKTSTFSGRISFLMGLPGNGPVHIEVYSLNGQRLWYNANSPTHQGHSSTIWDYRRTGITERVCLAVLTQGKFKKTIKIQL